MAPRSAPPPLRSGLRSTRSAVAALLRRWPAFQAGIIKLRRLRRLRGRFAPLRGSFAAAAATRGSPSGLPLFAREAEGASKLAPLRG